MTTTGRPMRADARRNYENLLAVATMAISEEGAEVSLEEIARRAGVGIGTLYRHFPTREALFEAVYRDGVEMISARAAEVRGTESPWDALNTWMHDFMAYSMSRRGLVHALKNVDRSPSVFHACKDLLYTAAGDLVADAQAEGTMRPDVELTHVFRLVHGIVLSTEIAPDGPELAERMLALVMDGLRHHP